MERQILLVKSNNMDNNKKEGRHENTLLRASSSTRNNLNLTEGKTKNIQTTDGNQTYDLQPFKAYAKDIKKAKKLCESGVIKDKDLNKVCFVTTDIFNKFAKQQEVEVVSVMLDKVFNELLIGTDPELLLMDNDEVIHAGNIPNFSKFSKFGCDGAMAELRPDPALTPKDLVKNIHSLLTNEELTSSIKKYDWLSACYFENANRDFPVGTHLHFDNPIKIKNLPIGSRKRLFAVTNKIIDELLTIPMIRLDGPSGHNRRAKCKMSQAGGFGNNYGVGYGFFGEWRTCNGRLEHRSLSGLVISDPKICEAVFGVGQAIVEAVYKEAVNNDLNSEFVLPKNYDAGAIYSKPFKDWEKIPLAETFGCIKPSSFMHEIMNKSSRIDISIEYIKGWLLHIRKLPTYGKYENYVEFLGELLSKNSKKLDKLDKNIKHNWGIV